MVLLKRWRILMQHQIYFIWMILMRLNGTRKLLGQGMKYRSDIIEPTTSYLGAQLKKKALSNGKNYWSLPSDIFVNAYIINMDEGYLWVFEKAPKIEYLHGPFIVKCEL